jgi:hypothetical protein
MQKVKTNYNETKKLSTKKLDREKPLSKEEIDKAFSDENSKTTEKFKRISKEYAKFLAGK